MTIKIVTKSATLDATKLREALQKVNYLKIDEASPVLAFVKVEFAKGKVTLITNNLEQIVMVDIAGVSNEAFAILLPGKTTKKFLSGANGSVSITQKRETQVSMSRDGIGKINLTTLEESSFPLSQPIPWPNLEWHTLDSKWFCLMLRIVGMACALEDSRPVLSGISCKDGEMAAANGFRLIALKDSRLAFGLGGKQAIIPLKTAILIQKLFAETETLEVAFEDKEETVERVYIKSGNVLMLAQLIIGTFPNYDQLIPKTFKCRASFSAPLLAQRLSMIDGENLNSGIVRYRISALGTGEQVCSISAGNEEDFEYKLSCPVTFDGDEAKIAFAYKYILEAAKLFSIVNMEITSPSSLGKFTGDIEGLVIMVMPMFVQW